MRENQAYVDENTLNVNIARVRNKFQEIGIEDAVETVRGAGYRLRITWKEDKSMKLFLREHVLLIMVQLFQCVMVPILFWLDGYTRCWGECIRLLSITAFNNRIPLLSVF